MKISKKVKIFSAAAICIIALLAVLIVWENGASSVGKVTLDTENGMTAGERIKDFDDLCGFLEDNVPMLYEYEELYGVSYEDTKKYYIELVSASENDYEYFTLLLGFFANIPSAHMAIGYPSMEYVDQSREVMDNPSFRNALPYWENAIHEECSKHYDEEIHKIDFAYYSGEYRGVSKPTDDDFYGINKAVLLTVNGVPADEFIKINFLFEKLKYDHVRGKPFRDGIYFNDKFGEKCTVEILDESGEKRSLEAYYGAAANIAMRFMEHFKSADRGENAPEVTADETEKIDLDKIDFTQEYTEVGGVKAARDKERNLLLLKVDTFEADGSYAAEILKRASEGIDNIIIDLRNNQGGFYFNSENLLAEVSPYDIKISNSVYITEKRYKSKKGDIEYTFAKNSDIKGLRRISKTAEIKGRGSGDKNYCLLISDYTMSAADEFTAEFKRNGLGTVIGDNNTEGERYGSTDMKILDRSGLYFYFTEFKYINPDGTDNSVYGTAPDIYFDTSVENYFLREEIRSGGENPYTIENRLKWDSVFGEAVETFK